MNVQKWGLLVAVAAVGCSKPSIEPAGTGARQAVLSYYEALLRREWDRAYSALDAGSQARCTPEQFSRSAQTYRNSLGFEPDAVHVQTCDERGSEATGHVVLTGRAATKEGRYKDAIALVRNDQGWHVVLSANFGRPAKR